MLQTRYLSNDNCNFEENIYHALTLSGGKYEFGF